MDECSLSHSLAHILLLALSLSICVHSPAVLQPGTDRRTDGVSLDHIRLGKSNHPTLQPWNFSADVDATLRIREQTARRLRRSPTFGGTVSFAGSRRSGRVTGLVCWAGSLCLRRQSVDALRVYKNIQSAGKTLSSRCECSTTITHSNVIVARSFFPSLLAPFIVSASSALDCI